MADLSEFVHFEGLTELLTTFKKLADDTGRDCNIEVGYSAPYAIYVHEDLEVAHQNGQAKFLEQPARQNRQKYLDAIGREWMRRSKAREEGDILKKSVITAAMMLIADSQKLVPVDTGILRGTAYVKDKDKSEDNIYSPTLAEGEKAR